jgi:hypothetical protein
MTEAALGPRPRESEACSHSRRVNSNTTSRPLDRIPAPPPLCLCTRTRLTQILTRRADSESHHSDFHPTAHPPAHKYTPALHPAHHSRTESPLHPHLHPCACTVALLARLRYGGGRLAVLARRAAADVSSSPRTTGRGHDLTGQPLCAYPEYCLEEPRLGGYVVLARRYVCMYVCVLLSLLHTDF